MNWLLKIADGPMKGAEIALTEGMRLKVGRGDDCDIVIADVSLAENAFELDVSSETVSLIGADGIARTMKPFETHSFGTTAVAIGPAEGEWEDLRPAQKEEPEQVESEVVTESATSETMSGEDDSTESTNESTENSAEDESSESSKSHLGIIGLVVLFVVLILAAAAAIWFFREPIVKMFPGAAETVGIKPKAVVQMVPASVTLAKIAKDHGLSFTEKDAVRTLSGNLSRRTERQAIRALALAADRFCKFDLSDDESLKESAAALLFTVTEGAIKVKQAAKRTVTLAGYAPDARALARVFEALRSDVPHADRIEAKEVRTGGVVPVELEGNVFARTGRLSERNSPVARLPISVDDKVSTPKPAGVAKSGQTNENVKVTQTEAVKVPTNQNNSLATIPPDEKPAASLAAVAQQSGGLLPKSTLPVAGILTKPYACVVLHDGHRLVEGAKISGLEIMRIEASRITFGWRGVTMRWEP